ncbi:MAG: alpha-E domain-containing protein, partial [Rhodospirillales bacterium]|nr:alpha-E domain-containing protein [Rhodospirillales bacterium]
GLRLALELCDSAITYRARYLAVVQPAPVLDLLLADDGNPRGLAFQLAAAEALLDEIAGTPNGRLAREARALAEEGRAMVRDVGAASDQAVAAAALPGRLRPLGNAIAALSDRVSRRYFALLRPTRTGGMGEAAD